MFYVLPDFQYGYRKNHNTSQARLDFTKYVVAQVQTNNALINK